jgi:hypothetical protein
MNARVWIALPLLSCALALRTFSQGADQTSAGASATQSTSGFGSIQGVVTFSGETPKSPIADDAGVRRELLEVDRDTRGLRYVVLKSKE